MSDIIELCLYPGYHIGEVDYRFDGLIQLMQREMDGYTWSKHIYITRKNAEELVKQLQGALEKGK